jgi:hypothetical protein
VFCSDVDLALHLIRFGRDALLHAVAVRRVHFDVEMSYSRDHGGADRVVRQIEAAIFGWYW